MTKRTKLLIVWLAAAGFLSISDDISRLESTVPAPRISSAQECAVVSRKVTIAKAREEMRRFLATRADTVSLNVRQAFADSDLVKSEYNKAQGCMVTVKLPIERLQMIAGKL